MIFSVVIPAYNEEKYIDKCLRSIVAASQNIDNCVEMVVVLNRCTDNTEHIAQSYGAKVVEENSKNLSKIRNVGALASSGDIIITIDADSWMSINLLKDIQECMQKNRYIGGGVITKPERVSLGIFLTGLFFLAPRIVLNGISMGLFWCHRDIYFAINGFDEELLTGEDLDFSFRLKKYGKKHKPRKGYKVIYSSYIGTSCRKWDQFGDWYVFKEIKAVKKVHEGRDISIADKWWYEVKR